MVERGEACLKPGRDGIAPVSRRAYGAKRGLGPPVPLSRPVMAPLIIVPLSGVAHYPNNKHDDRYAENDDNDIGHCAFLPNLSKANAAACAPAANHFE